MRNVATNKQIINIGLMDFRINGLFIIIFLKIWLPDIYNEYRNEVTWRFPGMQIFVYIVFMLWLIFSSITVKSTAAPYL